MEEKANTGLHVDQKAQGVWERKTVDRRWGQNQLFGSFRVEPGAKLLSQGDPTDNALAAIASILEKPTDKSVDKPEVPHPEEPEEPEEHVSVAPDPPQPASADAETYVKYGPGPLDAIRFKWTARPVGDGNYVVDETIGENSRTMSSAPMPKQDAIRQVDERERDARRRFEALKREMTGQSGSVPNPAGDDGGEI